jgi:2-polyprenyl-6-methoxyphenol hydroxylase-like FAD-dependent oxidoreductase
MASTRKVLIVGGGIGGLTAALALTKAGLDAVVFEQAARLEDVQSGGGLLVWNNGMRALREIGLHEQVQASAAVLDVTTFNSYRGDLLATWPIDQVARDLGVPTVGVVRGDLHKVLADALGPDAIQVGAHYESFEAGGHGVTVRFSDGREEHGDVLVGADGVRSSVRGDVLGLRDLRPPGYWGIQAVIQFDHPQAQHGMFATYWGPGSRFAYHHVGAGRLYWFAVEDGDGSEPAAERIQIVRERLKSWPEPVRSIIAATQDSEIAVMDIADAKPVKQWGTGPATLLGDAAHPILPNLGQGTSQALEDAVVFADALRGASDVVAALRSYEKRRAPRTAGLVNFSRNLGRLGRLKARPAVAFRERFMKFGLSRFGWKQAIALTSFDFLKES